MSSKEGYDVLRLINHNRSCYVSSEYVKGSNLVARLKYHPQMRKDVLFMWMRAMAKQLAQFHKCRGEPCYQYLNPYSVIVTEEQEIYFLDMGAESNEEELHIMQRRTVREHFLPPDAPYYQTASVELDIYGLGRTFQYLLSESDCEPELKKNEIAKLQKLISRCLNRHSKRAFQSASEIQKFIPEYKPIKERKSIKRKIWIPVVVVAAVTAGIVTIPKERGGEKDLKAKNKENKAVTSSVQKENEGEKYKLELGVLYFLELQDYERSREYFESVKNSDLAVNMAVVAECMTGENVQDGKLRRVLRETETELLKLEGKGTVRWSNMQALYYPCLIRAYGTLETKEDMENLLKLGESYMSLELTGEEKRQEVMRHMATAYERTEQGKNAISMYEQLILETEGKEKEEIYKKLAALYQEAGESNQTQEILRQGIEEFPQSAQLHMQYIKVRCQDPGVDREICRQTIEDTLKGLPDLEKDEEFQKLLKENGFEAEGGKVWIKE